MDPKVGCATGTCVEHGSCDYRWKTRMMGTTIKNIIDLHRFTLQQCLDSKNLISSVCGSSNFWVIFNAFFSEKFTKGFLGVMQLLRHVWRTAVMPPGAATLRRQDDGLPKRDKDAEERARRALEEDSGGRRGDVPDLAGAPRWLCEEFPGD